MGHLDDAIVALKKSVALNPNFFEAQNSLGHVFWIKGCARMPALHLKTPLKLGLKALVRTATLGMLCRALTQMRQSMPIIPL